MCRPVPYTKKQLLALLDDVRARVEADDSWEGHVEYLMPDLDDPDEAGADFMVKAGYRIGNSAGQGGMRIVAHLRPPE